MLNSGEEKIFGPVSADVSYQLRLRVVDALGEEGVFVLTLPCRRWAMKFRPDGQGVAFGKAAEQDQAMELPTGWRILIGGEGLKTSQLTNDSGFLSEHQNISGKLELHKVWENASPGSSFAAQTLRLPAAVGAIAALITYRDEVVSQWNYAAGVVLPTPQRIWHAGLCFAEKAWYRPVTLQPGTGSIVFGTACKANLATNRESDDILR